MCLAARRHGSGPGGAGSRSAAAGGRIPRGAGRRRLRQFLRTFRLGTAALTVKARAATPGVAGSVPSGQWARTAAAVMEATAGSQATSPNNPAGQFPRSGRAGSVGPGRPAGGAARRLCGRHPAVEQAPPRRDPSRYDEADVPREPVTALRPGEYQPWSIRIRRATTTRARTKDRKKVKSLAADRGLDWGLRNARRGAAAISRPIRVDCYADRLAMAPGAGRGGGQDHPHAQRHRGRRPVQFVAAVWERLDAWGIAGNRMYWRPILEVHVAPGGQQTFQELCILLDGSGMNIEQKAN